MFTTRLALAGLTVTALAAISLPAQQPRTLQIGMAKAFLSDQPKSFVDIATGDFQKVLKQTTGLAGEINSKLDPFEIAAKLESKQLDLGIFHAHEFAWVQKKHPDLQPLLIAADKHFVERAYVIVHKNNAAKTLGDLRGKKLDLPIGTKEPCRAFLNQVCGDKEAKGPAAYFGAIVKSESAVEALDNLARESVQAVIVDTRTLEFYKDVKGPVFNRNLRVLVQSEEFPPALIACKKGALDAAIRNQFETGLLKAHTIAEGRELMKTWNFDAFERMPKDFDKRLADVLKAYPPPTK